MRDVKKGIVADLGNYPVTLLLMLQGKWKTHVLYRGYHYTMLMEVENDNIGYDQRIV